MCSICSPFMVHVLEKLKCPFCHSWVMAVFCRIVSLQPVRGYDEIEMVPVEKLVLALGLCFLPRPG